MLLYVHHCINIVVSIFFARIKSCLPFKSCMKSSCKTISGGLSSSCVKFDSAEPGPLRCLIFISQIDSLAATAAQISKIVQNIQKSIQDYIIGGTGLYQDQFLRFPFRRSAGLQQELDYSRNWIIVGQPLYMFP